MAARKPKASPTAAPGKSPLADTALKPGKALPGVCPGDEVYVQHPTTGPHVGVVKHHGAHGATLKINGKEHKVPWEHIVAHRKRVSQSYDVVDEGEDGMIVQDEQNRRHFIAIPQDSREDKLMVKSLTGQRVVLLKKDSSGTPYVGAPGLSKKQITDKRGTQTTKWVRTHGEVPAAPRALAQQGQRARGDKVSFTAGDFKGSGEIVGKPGKDGAHVRDGSGRIHQVKHEEMQATPEKPDYEARNDGETDKAYAKRVVDKTDAPNTLPEDHDRYFDTEGSTHVPLDKLHSSKSDEENAQGGDNGPKRMLAAYHGQLGKRAPIKVMPHETKPGHYEVVDGNGTLTSAKKLKWLGLPAEVVSRDEGLRLKAEESATDAAKLAVDVQKYNDKPKKARQPFSEQAQLYDHAEEALTSLKEILTGKDGIATKMGLKQVTKGPGQVTPEEWDAPGGMLFIGKLKEADGRAKEKVDAIYGGDWSQLLDVVRCTMAVDNLHDVADVMQQLEASGMEVMQQPKDKFTKPTLEGYRDFNLVMKMPNGIAAEVQLNVKDMMKAKNVGHKEYEISRKIGDKYEKAGTFGDRSKWEPADVQEYDRSVAAQTKIYGDAWLNHIKQHYGSKNPPKEGGDGDASKMIKSMGVLMVFPISRRTK